MQKIESFSYNDSLKTLLQQNLQRFDDQRQTHAAPKAAAVALTVFAHDDEAALIVTRRSPRLEEHSGQWALPGGRIDEDEDALEAALRELQEEVNLTLPADDILGTLDDYVTRSGYVITPVVVWGEIDDQHLNPNPAEVASVHAFTFTELCREDSPNLEEIPESDRQVLSMNYLDDRIYAPTAALLYQFREVAILGRETRVLHYDQPVFAWS